MNFKITTIILTKNNEKELDDRINSVKSFSNVLIVDDFSSDGTVKRAKMLGAKVFKHKLKSFAEQRNFGLSKAKSDWVLFVDSDEDVTKKLQKEIVEKTDNKAHSGYYLSRIEMFAGKKLRYGDSGLVRLLRLARRKKGKWVRKVHEKWVVKGEIGKIDEPILHNSNSNFMGFINKLNLYTSIHAEENKKEKKNVNILKITLFPILKFLYIWIIKLGFLDGTRGLLFSFFMSFHSYLSWSKQWFQKNQE